MLSRSKNDIHVANEYPLYLFQDGQKKKFKLAKCRKLEMRGGKEKKFNPINRKNSRK